MPQKIGALVTGGDFQALGVLRTLAKKEIPVILLDSDYCIGRYSRYPKKFLKSPHPSKTESFVDFLTVLAKKEDVQGWVIFPNNDEAVYALSKYKNDLDKYYRIPLPDWDCIKKVYVKKITYQIAHANSIPAPKTFYPKCERDLLQLDIRFPVIIKPSIKDHFYNKIKIKAFRINDEKELINTYRRVCSIIDPSEVLIQEFIPGGPTHLYSFCPFFKNGQSHAYIMARRSRQHPMDFGHASTFAELVDIEQMKQTAEKFLRLINYYGIAEVEFMHDSRNGEYKLIEVNPRIWGWHTLAIAAGVDLPYLVYRDMLGEKMEFQPSTNHLKWVRLTTDIPTVLLEIIKGRMKIPDYLSSMKGQKEFSVFDLRDPLPFFAELVMTPYLWVRRGF